MRQMSMRDAVFFRFVILLFVFAFCGWSASINVYAIERAYAPPKEELNLKKKLFEAYKKGDVEAVLKSQLYLPKAVEALYHLSLKGVAGAPDIVKKIMALQEEDISGWGQTFYEFHKEEVDVGLFYIEAFSVKKLPLKNQQQKFKQLLKHSNPMVRAMALQYLAKSGDASVMPMIKEKLKKNIANQSFSFGATYKGFLYMELANRTKEAKAMKLLQILRENTEPQYPTDSKRISKAAVTTELLIEMGRDAIPFVIKELEVPQKYNSTFTEYCVDVLMEVPDERSTSILEKFSPDVLKYLEDINFEYVRPPWYDE